MVKTRNVTKRGDMTEKEGNLIFMTEETKKYLMAYFIGEAPEGEQIYFAVSEDGLHWADLNGGKPVLCSQIGEMGVRDPFILRARDGAGFFIIATDLRIASGKGWKAAQQEGSRSIIVWESRDLVHWSEARSCEVGLSKAGCVWAPEAVYDEERDEYMVFWASMVEGKHRIYQAGTRDFQTFSTAEEYIERPKSVIDTTMAKEDGVYYRFTKDETTSTIHMEAGSDLHGEFHEVASPLLDHLKGVEGPAIYQLPDGKWCLIVDHFAEGKGYMPLVCENLSEGDFQALPEEAYFMGKTRKRHGSVIALTEEEYQRLISAWGGECEER